MKEKLTKLKSEMAKLNAMEKQVLAAPDHSAEDRKPSAEILCCPYVHF